MAMAAGYGIRGARDRQICIPTYLIEGDRDGVVGGEVGIPIPYPIHTYPLRAVRRDSILIHTYPKVHDPRNHSYLRFVPAP